MASKPEENKTVAVDASMAHVLSAGEPSASDPGDALFSAVRDQVESMIDWARSDEALGLEHHALKDRAMTDGLEVMRLLVQAHLDLRVLREQHREPAALPNVLALSDHVRAEQVKLDFPDDAGDVRLTGLAGREVTGLLGLARAGPVRAVPGEGARGEDLEQERGKREISLLRGKKPRPCPSRRPGHAGS